MFFGSSTNTAGSNINSTGSGTNAAGSCTDQVPLPVSIFLLQWMHDLHPYAIWGKGFRKRCKGNRIFP